MYCWPYQLKVWQGHGPTCHTDSALHASGCCLRIRVYRLCQSWKNNYIFRPGPARPVVPLPGKARPVIQFLILGPFGPAKIYSVQSSKLRLLTTQYLLTCRGFARISVRGGHSAKNYSTKTFENFSRNFKNCFVQIFLKNFKIFQNSLMSTIFVECPPLQKFW